MGKKASPGWDYVTFGELFGWGAKSAMRSGDGKTEGPYRMFISSDTDEKRTDRFLETSESLVFGTGGKASCHYVNEPFSYTTDCVVAHKKTDGICSKFYYYYLRQNRLSALQSTFSGIGLQHTSKKKIEKIRVPVMPLPEQERIVAWIEALFSQLDSGVETLKKTKRQLMVYRQAVLKEAFRDIADSVPMRRVAAMIDPQPSHRTPPEREDGIPYIGIGDIDYINGRIHFDSARKVSPSVLDEHLQRYCLRKGDFIMGKIGTIGKPFRVVLPQNYTLSANVILIQPKAERIDPDFLFWQFSSPWVTQQLTKGSSATSQPAFGIKKARSLSIRLPSSHVQRSIVEMIESRLSVCDSIEQTIDAALQQADALRQSILKKAFEGYSQ